MADLRAAVKKALKLGAVDAVKHLVLCQVEKRPPRLDLDVYPYLPAGKCRDDLGRQLHGPDVGGSGMTEDILAAKEIRQVRGDELDCFDPPRNPPILPRPTRELCHLNVWQYGAWVELDPEAVQPEGMQP